MEAMDSMKRKRSATEEDPTTPSGPATARRPKKADRILAGGTRASVSVVKTSLSSVINKDASSLRAWLPEALEYCNKTRVLMTLIMKLHIYSCLDKNPTSLPFYLDQNYVSRVSTMVRFGKLKTRWDYDEEGLKRIARQVINYGHPDQHDESVQPGLIPCPKLLVAEDDKDDDVHNSSFLTGTTIASFLSRICLMLITNIQVHVKTHIEDCVANWFKNKLTALLDQDDYDRMQQRSISDLKKRLEQTQPQALQLLLAQQAGLVTEAQEFAELLNGGDEEESKEDPKEGTKEETKEELSKRRRQRSKDDLGNAVAFMYRLRKEVDLEAAKGRNMKLYSVLPEATIGITPVSISTEVVRELAKQRALLSLKTAWQRAIGAAKKKEAQASLRLKIRELNQRTDWSEEETWGAEFDMKKVHSLRNAERRKFDLLIDTDGVYASVHFYHVCFPVFFSVHFLFYQFIHTII
jgi:hypothetical protein